MTMRLSYIRLSCFAVIAFLGLPVSCFSQSQSPYRLDWRKELTIGGTGATALAAGTHFKNKVTLFTSEDFEKFDASQIPETDRIAVSYNSGNARDLSDHFLHGSHLLPFLFLAPGDSRAHFGQIAVMYGEVILVNGGLTTLIKYTARRPRPYVYNPDTPTQSLQTENAQASFISGHASATAAATFFTAKVFSDFYPDSPLKPVVWTAAIITPAITGYLRVRAGKHYPTDVIGGYALGAAIGYLVPHLHKQSGGLNRNLTILAAPGSVSLGLTF